MTKINSNKIEKNNILICLHLCFKKKKKSILKNIINNSKLGSNKDLSTLLNVIEYPNTNDNKETITKKLCFLNSIFYDFYLKIINYLYF